MEPLTLYERLEALYQRAWHFQLQHADRLEPSERGWLAQILQELTYDLDKLAAALDIPPPFVRPARSDDPPEVVLRLAGRLFWLAEVRGRLAEYSRWLGERWAALAERDWQAALHDAGTADRRSPSGRKPEPVPRSSTAARGRSRTTGG